MGYGLWVGLAMLAPAAYASYFVSYNVIAPMVFG